MNGFFALLFLASIGAILVSTAFLLYAVLRKTSHNRRRILLFVAGSIGVCIISGFLFGATRTTEQIAAGEQRRAEERAEKEKEAADKQSAEQRTAAEDKRQKGQEIVDKKAASQEILQILGALPMRKDEVEKTNWYQPWGDREYPAEDNVYWYAGNKNDQVWMRTLIVNFSSDIDWVFWDKLIFSTDQGRWEYNIGSFAGQSGNGKHTQVVMGGKYETLDVPYYNLFRGYQLLVDGTNPIIRLQGKEYHVDIRISPAQMETIKQGVRLSYLLSKTEGKIIR